MAERTVVVAGGGLAAAKTAEALRAEGFDGAITLIGAETDVPYERPALSKGYLQGGDARESIDVHPRQWYADNGVDLRLGSPVTEVDAEEHRVSTADGERLRYDTLVLATGSRARRLDLPRADPAGLHHLRDVADSDRLRAALRPDARVVIVGAGWIGLETAAAAVAAGAQVTVVEVAELPLVRVLGPEVARAFADLHRAHGVDLRLGRQVRDIVAAGDGNAVHLDDGATLPADVVVVGIGAQPNVEAAVAAGLDVDNGVLVDEHLRSAHPDVLAVGDIANAWHPGIGRRIRVEHWANALNQPAVAARTALGIDAAYDRPPYFFTDQYDLGMEFTGWFDPAQPYELVVRGDLDAREFVAFWLVDGSVAAAMNVNVWDVTEHLGRLVRAATTAEPARLADPDVALADLA
ncbi:pyridine nucleotide-disulfide oxidoreductase [Pseudonocardia sulfidoxydans NBRC 16205]|uniref:Pyridine nucleotide-disulfide oxidoreductase n=1 Tax=Pseudonocardia sulfidoxydans NBRC 16205 TaxID=1223511 RepID=A0A511DAR1_9PSEU|nr:FAD-dependent oxidoreductase [Pseudonocardia sulfidoxydans]GEL21890.1 pyridine nucleotide-disulfide oxidoreductase [Pseudonocardia sulfidoxydans NBRC 16205]